MQTTNLLIFFVIGIFSVTVSTTANLYCWQNASISQGINPLKLPTCNDTNNLVYPIITFAGKLSIAKAHPEFIAETNASVISFTHINALNGSVQGGKAKCEHVFLGDSIECEEECLYPTHFNKTVVLGCHEKDPIAPFFPENRFCDDSAYLEQYANCTAIVGDANCFCEIKLVESFDHGSSNNKDFFSEDSVGIPVFYKYKPAKVSDDNVFALRVIVGHDTTAELVNNELFITMKPIASFHTLIRKGDFSTIKSIVNSTLLSFFIPVETLHVSGTLYVDIFVGTEEYYHQIPVVGVSICRLKDCLLCMDSLKHFSCLPSTHKFAVLFVIIFLSLIAIVFLPFIGWFLWIALRIIYFPFKFFFKSRFCMKSRIFKIFIRKFMTAKEKASYYVGNEEGNEEETVELNKIDIVNDNSTQEKLRNEMLNANRVKAKPKYRPQMLLFICLFAFNFKYTTACDLGFDVEATMTNCIQNSAGNDVCSAEVDAEISLLGVKSTTCLSVKDPTTKQTLATIKLFYSQHNRRLQSERLYYTSSWSFNALSHHVCWDSDHCKSHNCANTGPNDRSAGGTFDDYWINWPGETTCRRSCGCLTCGCFLCESSCVFEAYGIVPFGEICAIDDVLQVDENPIVEYTLTDNTLTNQSGSITLELGTGLSTTSGIDFNFKMISSFTSSKAEFGEKKLIRCGPNAYFQVASPKNSPTAQTIGDIQATSSSKLTISSGSAFIFPDMVSKSNQDKSTTFSAPLPGLRTLDSKSAFPLQIGSTLWRIDDDKLNGIFTGTASIQLGMTITGSLLLERTTDQVCPQGKLVNITGCRDCVEGFSAYFTLRSSCHSGMTSLSTKDENIIINTRDLFLSLDDSLFLVRGSTTNEENDFEVLFDSGNGKSLIIELKFTAVESVTLRNNDKIQIDGSRNDSESESITSSVGNFFKGIGNGFVNAIENAFKGIGKWWEYLVTIGIFILIAVGIILLLPYIYPLFNTCSKAIKSRKSKKEI